MSDDLASASEREPAQMPMAIDEDAGRAFHAAVSTADEVRPKLFPMSHAFQRKRPGVSASIAGRGTHSRGWSAKIASRIFRIRPKLVVNSAASAMVWMTGCTSATPVDHAERIIKAVVQHALHPMGDLAARAAVVGASDERNPIERTARAGLARSLALAASTSSSSRPGTRSPRNPPGRGTVGRERVGVTERW